MGRPSVEVTIEVFAENIFKQTRRHTNTARITTVAIRDGKPVEVPRLICETRDEKIRFLEGKLRRDMRSQHKADFESTAEKLRNASEAQLDEMMGG